MRNFKAIFTKQMTSQLRSPALLVQAALFIGLVLVFTFIATDDGRADCLDCIPAYVCEYHAARDASPYRPDPSMAGMFTVMFAGLVLVSSAGALVQEDKTTNNLRFMTMAGVKPRQYLLGTGLSIVILSTIALVGFSLVGRYFGVEMLRFMALAFSGSLVSILLGIALGLSKWPAVAGLLSMILGFAPMLTQFNDGLARALRFLFTMQISLGVSDLERPLSEMSSNFIIIGINGLVVLVFFVWMHRRGELRW